MWHVVSPRRGEVHVYPLGDLVGHETEARCACGPTRRLVPGSGGGRVGYMWVHHSVDGREMTEQARDAG